MPSDFTLLNVKIEARTNGTIVRVDGDATTTQAGKLRLALFRGAASLTSPVVLDLSGLTYLSSPALAVLLEFHKHLSRIAGTVRLAGLSPRIRNVLAITRLDHL